MIDAGPSLRAAEGLTGSEVAAYLLTKGWAARPSRIDGVSILSKSISNSDRLVELILPVAKGFDDEQRRVADALRTVAQLEGSSVAAVARDIRQTIDSANEAVTESSPDGIEQLNLAEKSVAQAKQAFDGIAAAAQQAVTRAKAQARASDMSWGAMTFAERNVATSFAFAQKLAQARDLEEVLRLQAEFMKAQMQALAEQAKELGASFTQAAPNAAFAKAQMQAFAEQAKELGASFTRAASDTAKHTA